MTTKTKKLKIPAGYKVYEVTLIGKKEGCGPFDAISRDTVHTTRMVQEFAHKAHPDADFLTAEAIWIENKNPTQELLKKLLKTLE